MNLGQLKTAVAAYAHRSDLASMFPTFLALAEERIYTGEANAPKLRVAVMRHVVQMADGTRPNGFLEAIKVAEADRPDKPLTYAPMDYMPQQVRAFSWDGETLVLSRDQGFPVDMTYYAKLATPALDANTNWILTNHARVYLSAVLVEVGMWTQNDALAAREAANFASAVNAINSKERAAQISGSSIKVRR